MEFTRVRAKDKYHNLIVAFFSSRVEQEQIQFTEKKKKKWYVRKIIYREKGNQNQIFYQTFFLSFLLLHHEVKSLFNI